MRERWFGATGHKVPEIVLEGTLTSKARSSPTTCPTSRQSTLPTTQALRSSVRAATAEEVHAALSLGPWRAHS
jgi:hypothetical protein